MSVGFVLIKVTHTLEHEVYNKLLKIPQIIELHPLFDEYDLIAKIEAEDFDKIGDIVINEIRPIKGVLDTKTLTGSLLNSI